MAEESVKESVEAVGEAVAPVAEHVGERIQDAAHVVQEGAQEVGEGIHDVAEHAAPVVEEGLEHVQDAAHVVVETVEDVGEAIGEKVSEATPLLGAAASHAKDTLSAIDFGALKQDISFPAVGELQTRLVESAGPILFLASGMVTEAGQVLKKVFDLIKLEICRDFAQIIGLMFAGLHWPKAFTAFWGKITQLANVDFHAVIPSIQPTSAFWICFILGMILVVATWRTAKSLAPDEEEDGLEVKRWADQGKWSRRWAKILLTILISLYMPISKNAVQILVCDESWIGVLIPQDSSGKCWSDIGAMYIIPCFLGLGLVTLGLPYLCYKLVQDNKPEPVEFDAQGHAQTYTDAHYKADLVRDECPYKFLYDGYERKWAYYKTIVMVIKFVLLLPVILLKGGNTFGLSESKALSAFRMLGVMGVLGVYTFLSFKTSPFLQPENDYMDMSGRVTSLFTAVIGLFVLMQWGGGTAWGVLLNIVHALNAALMAGFWLSKNPKIQAKLKAHFGRLDFSKDLTYGNGTTPIVYSPNLDLAKERKLRIWHVLWNAILLGDDELKPPEDQKFSYADTRDTPCYLLNYKGTVGERHLENCAIVADIGRIEYEKGLAPVPDMLITARDFAMRALVGLDVYWDGAPQGAVDGGWPNGSPFGKFYCVPFPFTGVLVFDEKSKPKVVLHGDNVGWLMEKNHHPEVERQRGIRMQLRALQGQMCHFHHQETHTKTKQRQKSRQVRDPNTGNTRTEYYTESYTVNVLFTFTNGRGILAQNKSTMVTLESGRQFNASAGFGFSLHYNDGTGVDHEGKHWANESCTIGHQTLGIHPGYAMTGNLSRLLNDGGNAAKVASVMSGLMSIRQEYRDKYYHEARLKVSNLSYAFWSVVFNNDTIERSELHNVLMREPKKEVRQISDKYAPLLDATYAKLALFNHHPASAYWFVFWDDVWKNNKDSHAVFKEHADILDPANSQALAYRPSPRDALEKELEGNELRTAGKKGFFDDKVLSALYNNLTLVGQGRKPLAVV